MCHRPRNLQDTNFLWKKMHYKVISFNLSFIVYISILFCYIFLKKMHYKFISFNLSFIVYFSILFHFINFLKENTLQ
jgi:phosphoglycerol transferase MdoB-like AlkP superfamily enzyme